MYMLLVRPFLNEITALRRKIHPWRANVAFVKGRRQTKRCTRIRDIFIFQIETNKHPRETDKEGEKTKTCISSNKKKQT